MARLFDWLNDAVRNPKIFGARLNAEFDNFSASFDNATFTGFTAFRPTAANTTNGIGIGPGTGPGGAGAALTTIYQNGTLAAPTTTLQSNEICFFQGYAWDGTTFAGPALAIVCIATQDFTPTAHGAAWVVQGISAGTITGQNECFIQDGLTLPSVGTDAPAPGLGLGTVNAKGGLYDNGTRVITGAPLAFGCNQTQITGGNTFYYGVGSVAGPASEASLQIPMPTACTLDKLELSCTPAPGAGKNFVCHIMKNGVATALTATISGTAKIAQDATHSVSFAARDLVDLRVVTDAGAASANVNACVRVKY